MNLTDLNSDLCFTYFAVPDSQPIEDSPPERQFESESDSSERKPEHKNSDEIKSLFKAPLRRSQDCVNDDH